MLQRMEKHGLIIRVNDPKDKRKKQAQLTESALRIVPKIRQYMKQDNEEVLGNLSMKDVNIITAFLKNIKEGKAND